MLEDFIQQFNDPIAEQIAWNSIAPKVLLCPQKLSKIDSETGFRFKITSGCDLLYVLALAFPCPILLAGFHNTFWLQIVIPVTLIFFITFLIIDYYFVTMSIIFSKTKVYFYKGNINEIKAYFHRKQYSEQSLNNNTYEKQIPFEQIHAIQLILINVGQKHFSLSYQLNLVLHNTERINVIQNKKKEQIRKDANELSRFLGVPLWDAIDYQHIS